MEAPRRPHPHEPPPKASPEPEPEPEPERGPERESETGRPLIVVDHLTKRFSDKLVLDDLCLSIERGETMVIIGGSGAGKSTLARHLIGLEKPTSGRVLIDGVDLTSLGARERVELQKRFGVVFQRGALLDSFDVFDNVAFPLREELHLAEPQVKERVMRYLAELGVEEAAHKLPAQLSGGMAKRVGIARAMATEPEILIYDEPTSGLDPITSRVVDDLIEQMRARFSVTSVVITHDMATAFEVADRVALLSGGRIVAEGPPETVFETDLDEVKKFAASSGIDPERLGPRRERKPPWQVRQEWAARRAQGGAHEGEPALAHGLPVPHGTG